MENPPLWKKQKEEAREEEWQVSSTQVKARYRKRA